MPDTVCILNNERSKPPALAKNSKYLTINKKRKYCATQDIFPFKLEVETIFPQYTTKHLKIWAFWVIYANKPYLHWLIIKPPLLICTHESDPDDG